MSPRSAWSSHRWPPPADPILQLSQVEAGILGEARTVVRGNEIIRFPVTVIAVDRERSPQALGSLGPEILMRASGPVMEQTGGLAAGMSGSPVYVTGADGLERVIGAISFGTGDEANLSGGITLPSSTCSRSARYVRRRCPQLRPRGRPEWSPARLRPGLSSGARPPRSHDVTTRCA